MLHFSTVMSTQSTLQFNIHTLVVEAAKQGAKLPQGAIQGSLSCLRTLRRGQVGQGTNLHTLGAKRHFCHLHHYRRKYTQVVQLETSVLPLFHASKREGVCVCVFSWAPHICTGVLFRRSDIR